MKPSAPLITDIKRHSLEDGPGIRSVVFFKGCPLRCVFCQNPETQSAAKEIVFREERCVGCGACAAACPPRIVSMAAGERILRDRCDACGACAEACPSGALTRIGRAYAIDELVDVLLRDKAFYDRSGGGVTFSGGECTLFPAYLERLARTLKAHAIHLAVETCGEFAGDWFVARLLPHLDLVFFDVKFADSALHRRHTGRDNQRMLDNLSLLLHHAPERVRVRVPLVPDVTATRENLEALAVCLRARGVREAILLPYNPMGLSMHARLGRAMPGLRAGFMSKAELDEAIAQFKTAVAKAAPPLPQAEAVLPK